MLKVLLIGLAAIFLGLAAIGIFATMLSSRVDRAIEEAIQEGLYGTEV